eukprot:564143-Prymnesium_polylepis.1
MSAYSEVDAVRAMAGGPITAAAAGSAPIIIISASAATAAAPGAPPPTPLACMACHQPARGGGSCSKRESRDATSRGMPRWRRTCQMRVGAHGAHGRRGGTASVTGSTRLAIGV